MTIEEIKERRKEYGHISNHPVLKDVDWLIQRIEDLELTRNKAERCSCVFEEDGETILRWCDAHAIWRDKVKELETKIELLIKDKNVLHDLFLKYHARVGKLEAEFSREMTYKETVEVLERDLKFNAHLLAKQCDLAREAETKEYGCKKVIEEFKTINPRLETRIRELEADLTIKMLENAKGAQVLAQVEAERMALVNGIKKHRVDRYDNPIPENEWGNGGYDYYDEELYRLVEGK